MANITIETATKTGQAERAQPPRYMSVMGVGLKIAIPSFLYLTISGIVSWFFRPFFRITGNYSLLRRTSVAMAIVGFTLNLVAAFSMLKAHKEERLATGGFYRLFRDPMYVLQIFITLPGLVLLFNSWLMLAGVIPAYSAYRIFVREEHQYLEKRFGETYREYLKKVLLKI